METATNISEFRPEQRSLVETFADKYGVDAKKLIPALKQTAFQSKQEITDAQMMALLVVANQYDLNPFTKEIYAYPDKGGIVPVVSVDGWSRIINENPEADGAEFTYSEEMVEFNGHKCHAWIECSMYRKGRSHPVTVREYFDEVKRELNYANPWKSHPNRMHRHKAWIQCARLAFGFAGIYDQDEAERIVEAKKVGTSPKDEFIGTYNTEQKTYYNQVFQDGDDIEMYVLSRTMEEGTWVALYDSFEKGEKMKSKAKVNQMCKDGESLFLDTVALCNDAKDCNDSVAFNEAIEGLSPDAIKMLLDRVEPETAAFYREITK